MEPGRIQRRVDKLLVNSRFWILAWAVVLSVIIAGLIELSVPDGSLRVIRTEQWYGFISILLLYVAVLASPLTKVLPDLIIKGPYLHARRAIGVSAFYYAFLHVYLSFFKQLGGFGGIAYFDTKYNFALLLGITALAILFVMAATSLDWAVKTMHFKNWKLLHRLVYVACLAVLLHVMLIGPHYTQFSVLGAVTYAAAGVLVLLEVLRARLVITAKRAKK
jgi:DMSO/TMAO reductase YedYZ heme-binding membrane subunit